MNDGPLGGVEEQFHLLMECITDYAILFLDPEGRVANWNSGAERIFGYQETEILGKPFAHFFPPEAIQAGLPERELNLAAQSGRATDDSWLIRKDGARLWVSGITTALRDEQGRLRGYAKVLRDMTERRRVVEAMQASERRYRALVENAWDGVTLVAADGSVLDTTPVTFRGLGYTLEEYIGRNSFDLLHPDDVPAVRSLLASLLQQPGGKMTAQYRLRHRDGSWRWVEAVGTNLLDEPSVHAIVVNHRDITDRKEADRRKDEWLSMLAHELRGPLSPVSSAVQVLLRMGAEPEVRSAEEVIARQTQHLSHIVDDLLEVTRLLRGQIRLRKERLDLTRLAHNTAADYHLMLAEAGMSLTLDAPETPVWVSADATRLHQVLANLLDNAIKFRNGGSQVEMRIWADRDHDRAGLVVRDAGIGIEAKLLPVLFDVFSQAERGLHRPGGGLGLGLSLVKGLIELHGGEVKATSPGPGRGAEFTLLLPLEREPAALTAVPVPPALALEKLRILVVEDNKDAADSLQMLLSFQGHDVRVAYAGPDGIRMATAWGPDVIISDIGLPGLDGYRVASELRQHPATARTRLIAITGYGSEEDRRRALASGFDHLLTKPADPAELQQLLIRSV
jgi:PAS domain S-box-containing protein